MGRQALVVGIDEYPAPNSLYCCAKDARAVSQQLKAKEYGYEVLELYNEDATRQGILFALRCLIEKDANEYLFYFSGHGCSTDIDSYIVSVDAANDEEGIELDKLRRLLMNRKNKSSTVTVILDCCHAGSYTLGSETVPGFDRKRLEEAIPAQNTGHAVLAACGPAETAVAMLGGENSLFTTALLSGLEGAAANEKGEVTVSSLHEYIASKLADTPLQKPVFRADIQGTMIVGAGFAPVASTRLTATHASSLVDQAKGHLDAYLRRKSVGLDEWKSHGYMDSCKAFEPILTWFRKRLSEHADLHHNKDFMDTYRSAVGRLAQLGNLDAGTCLPKGTITGAIGSGAFGRVWKVESKDSGATTAYKTFHPNELTVSDKIKRFRRGYDAMKQLNHPRIVSVLDYTEVPLGFFMEYVDGPNLRDCNPAASVPPIDILVILAGVAETLQHAHIRQVVHRDVKPENILLLYDGEAKVWIPFLTDFDLAWFSTATQFTQDGIGTYQYAAPEQLAAPRSSAAHARSVDFYAFGQLMYFAITGSDPAPNDVSGCEANLTRALGKWGSEAISRSTREIYQHCTQTDPRKRPSTFRSVAERIAALITEWRNVDRERFDLGQLFKEIAYSIIGLELRDSVASSTSFKSPSQQTLVTLSKGNSSADDVPGTVTVEARFIPVGAPYLEGVTGPQMRKLLNQRVDRALEDDAQSHRKSGTQGKYEVYVAFSSVTLNKSGVDRCRRNIAQVIDALEGS